MIVEWPQQAFKSLYIHNQFMINLAIINQICSVNKIIFTNVTSSVPTSYLFRENFEETGGYENVWTETLDGETINPNYTEIVLEGLQSLQISSSAGIPNTETNFSSSNEIWGYFMFHPISQLSTIQPLRLRNPDASVFIIERYTAGNIAIYNGSSTDSSVNTMSLNTTYHVWFHYKTGSGSDSIAEVAFSTDGIKPISGGSYVQVINGTSTLPASELYLGPYLIGGNFEYVFDKIRLNNTSSIGDNPI